ncbi:unnamed protein product [Effrenium voratum]|nr:unnamed protein product [Effrenium voratum]
MAFTFAVLQSSMIAQWPGRGSQLSFKAIVNQILWGPALQLLVFLAEVRAFLLCIRYGSAGQTGPLQYRAQESGNSQHEGHADGEFGANGQRLQTGDSHLRSHLRGGGY